MRVGNVKEIVFSKDPKQMNWLREDFPYAEVKCPPEFSAEVQNEKDGDVLTTKIVVSYNGAHPYFTNAGSIGVSFPLQDRYTDSATCWDYRCHAHIFCGENASYIMAPKVEMPNLEGGELRMPSVVKLEMNVALSTFSNTT